MQSPSSFPSMIWRATGGRGGAFKTRNKTATPNHPKVIHDFQAVGPRRNSHKINAHRHIRKHKAQSTSLHTHRTLNNLSRSAEGGCWRDNLGYNKMEQESIQDIHTHTRQAHTSLTTHKGKSHHPEQQELSRVKKDKKQHKKITSESSRVALRSQATSQTEHHQDR